MGNGTNIGRVRGLGSAKSGTHHWMLQRFTAIGNLILGLWLLFSLVGLPDLGFKAVKTWAAQPISATALALFVLTTFWHARLGLQVLIEDYVHGHVAKLTLIILIQFAAFAFATAAIIALLVAAFAG